MVGWLDGWIKHGYKQLNGWLDKKDGWMDRKIGW